MKRVRFFGISVYDLLAGIIGMILIFLIARHYHFKNLSAGPFICAAILLTIPVGIIFHVIFGVNTALNSDLGLSNPVKT